MFLVFRYRSCRIFWSLVDSQSRNVKANVLVLLVSALIAAGCASNSSSHQQEMPNSEILGNSDRMEMALNDEESADPNETARQQAEIARIKNEQQIKQLLLFEDAIHINASNADVRELVRIGEPAIPYVLETIRQGGPTFDVFGIMVIGESGVVNAEVAEVLRQLFERKSPIVRTFAAEAAGKLDVEVDRALEVLRQIVFEVDHSTYRAIRALEFFDASNANVIDLLADVLKNSSKGKVGLRRQAAEVLGSFGPLAIHALPALQAALKDKSNENIERDLADAIRKIDLVEDIAEFRDHLKRDNLYLQSRAIVGLGKIGPHVGELRVDIEELTTSENPLIARLAATTLPKIGMAIERKKEIDLETLGACKDEDAASALQVQIEELISHFRHGKPRSDKAVQQLLTLGEPVIPFLLEYLRLEYDRRRSGGTACDVLRGLNADANNTVFELLTICLEDPLDLYDSDRYFLLNDLILELEHDQVTARLILLHHPRQDIRFNSAKSLDKVDPASVGFPTVVDALIHRLNDIDGNVRAVAAQSLGRLGPAASKAFPVLLVAAQQPYKRSPEYTGQRVMNSLVGYKKWGVRGFAALAVKEIGLMTPEIRTAIVDSYGKHNPTNQQARNGVAVVNGGVESHISGLIAVSPKNHEQIRVGDLLGIVVNPDKIDGPRHANRVGLEIDAP